MHPLISENKFRIEIDKILNDDLQKVHSIVLQLPAKTKHVV